MFFSFIVNRQYFLREKPHGHFFITLQVEVSEEKSQSAKLLISSTTFDAPIIQSFG
jgi:hypothetical protein